ncbi:Uncharacterised protein [Mycobacterium tuberculosis]|nr:Uncharacterised protein [Mycobacterium tuberculosis]
MVVVQEGNDLFGDVSAGIETRVGPAATVGGQYQHVRLVDLDPAMQRYPRGGNTQFLHKAVGVLRHAGEIDQAAPRDIHGTAIFLIYVCRARRSALPRRAP